MTPPLGPPPTEAPSLIPMWDGAPCVVADGYVGVWWLALAVVVGAICGAAAIFVYVGRPWEVDDA